MRQNINPELSEIRIKNLFRNPAGNINIRNINKIDIEEITDGSRQTFYKAAQQQTMGKTKITWQQPKRTLLLRDIGNLVTAMDIKEAVSRETGIRANEVEVNIKKFDQGHKNTKTYATITPHNGAGKALKNKERIIVGWTQHRTKFFENPPECFRCEKKTLL